MTIIMIGRRGAVEVEEEQPSPILKVSATRSNHIDVPP
jgi:hypothetical protein